MTKDQLREAISDAINNAAGEAHCCGCYCDQAAEDVMILLARLVLNDA